MSAPIQLWLRDQLYAPIDIVDDFISLSFVRRFNDIGTWEAEFATDSVAAHYMTENRGIIVVRDGITIFSGIADGEFTRTRNTLRMSGHDDNILLDVPARPTPSLSNAPYPDQFDVTTGIASTIIRSLVDRNIGPSAPVAWKIPNLVLGTDPLLGTTITARANLDPLITLLKELSVTPIAGGLGFELIQSSPHSTDLVFNIYEPPDKSTTEFSIELGTIIDFEDTRRQPQYNYFIVGGGDDFGINRTIVEDFDGPSVATIGRRKAAFIDARGVTDLSELFQKAAEYVAGAVPSRKVSVTPLMLDSLRYGIEYSLGCLVRFTVEGQSYDAIIREVRFEYGAEGNGEKITPLIADAGSSDNGVISQQISSIEGRLSNIERNYNVPDDSITEAMLHPYMKWLPGDLKVTSRSTSQAGWLLCDGSIVNRNTYSRLFAAIGELYGSGDGSTTFSIPDFRDRAILGAGVSHFLADAGTGSVSISHTHTHSHGGGNLVFEHVHSGQAHTHPGSHSHGPGNLAISHDHTVDINHSHASQETGGVSSTFSDITATTPTSTTGTNHRHNVVISATGTNNKTSSTPNNISRSGSTDPDSNAPAASYSGSASSPSTTSWTGGTDPDSTSGGGSITAIPPHLTVNILVYTGV